MEKESVYNSFPELKELENKIGMKIPDILLRWMNEPGRENSPEHLHNWGDYFNDKISHLKLEMGGLGSAGLPAVYSAVCGLQGCLRAADVQILHQLLVVHQGMEAVRWMLQEEQATLASHSSSLTSSQCSLADSAPGMSPGEGPSSTLTGLHDSAKPSKEPEHEPDRICWSHRCSNMTSDKRPPSDLALCVSTGGSGQIWFSTSPNTTTTTTTHPAQTMGQQDSQQGAPQWAGLEPKRTAFPGDTRRGVSGEDQDQDHTGQTGPAACSLPEETLWARNMEEEGEEGEQGEEEQQSVPGCEMLLGYDAQWCWVESQDDVTFL